MTQNSKYSSQCTFCGGGPRDLKDGVFGECPSCGSAPISIEDLNSYLVVEGDIECGEVELIETGQWWPDGDINERGR